jgi:hypothetical protein
MDGVDKYHSGAGAGAGADSDGEADGRGDDAEGGDVAGAGADAAGGGDGDGGDGGGGAHAPRPSFSNKRCPVCTTTYNGDRAMPNFIRHLRESKCRLSEDVSVWTAERLSELHNTLGRLGYEAVQDEGGGWKVQGKGGVPRKSKRRRKR